MLATQRTLVVHAGGSKTGSSAIQNFCEAQVDMLARHGWGYLNALGLASPYQVTSGNGTHLYTALYEASPHDLPRIRGMSPLHCPVDPILQKQALDERVASYLGDFAQGLCSCEWLQHCAPTHWALLQQSAQRLGVLLRVVVVVRDLVPWYLSQYDQSLKDGGVTIDLVTFAREKPWHHLTCLRALDEALAPEQITVLSYELCKASLLPSFFEAVDSRVARDAVGIASKVTVNRSLTAAERDILLMYGRHLGRLKSDLFEAVFYTREPERVVRRSGSAELASILHERYGGELAWINQRFFGGQEVVGLGCPPASRDASDASDLSTQEDPDVEGYQLALDWAFARLAGHERDLATIASFASNPSSLACPPDLDGPADFDPVAYLLLNRDVLASGMNPWLHYQLHGRAEGRRYHSLG
jgi:hypothetical protein